VAPLWRRNVAGSFPGGHTIDKSRKAGNHREHYVYLSGAQTDLIENVRQKTGLLRTNSNIVPSILRSSAY